MVKGGVFSYEIVRKMNHEDQCKLQNRLPNFLYKKKFFLLRCYVCGGRWGKENYPKDIGTGSCAWCGWSWESKT